jgi:hypothetical protein
MLSGWVGLPQIGEVRCLSASRSVWRCLEALSLDLSLASGSLFELESGRAESHRRRNPWSPSRQTGQRYRNDNAPTAGKKPARPARAAAVSASLRTARGASIEVREERMDITSAHREVGTYRGAAVACGTESRCRSWAFLPLGAEARLS